MTIIDGMLAIVILALALKLLGWLSMRRYKRQMWLELKARDPDLAHYIEHGSWPENCSM